MKREITRGYLLHNYNCMEVGYGRLQHLLYFVSPTYYHSGVYGWNFDAYTFYAPAGSAENGCCNFCITTGYRSTIHNCKVAKDLKIEEYDNKARALLEDWHDYSTEGYENKAKEVNALLSEFLSNAFGTVIEV